MSAKRLQNIGIFGVAGYNRGDDAISDSLIAGFRAIKPDLKFTVPVISPPAAESRNDSESQFLLSRSRPAGQLRLIREISRCDAIVLGGGSLIQDQLGGGRLSGILGYSWNVAMLCRLMGKPLITAPMGVDKLHTDAGRCAAREVLKCCHHLYVRDTLSKDMAVAVLPEIAARTSVICDPVFGYRVPHLEHTPAHYVLAPAFEGRNEDRLVQIFTTTIARLAETVPEARFTIAAMDERPFEDGGKIDLIRAALPQNLKDRTDLAVPEDAAAAAKLMRGSRGVVAMRLHALILGYGYVPLFCLSRTTKTEAMIKSYNLPGATLSDGASPEELSGQVVAAMARQDQVSIHAQQREDLALLLDNYYAEAFSKLEERSMAR